MKVSIQMIKIIVFFLLLIFSYPCFSFQRESAESIDSVAISWVIDYYKEGCDFWFKSNEKYRKYYKNTFYTECLHVFQIGKQEYDSVIVTIYITGISIDDIGFDKLLIQKKYKDDHSEFEFIWDNPKDIDQIIKIIDFFEKYNSFSDQVKLECITRAVIIYENTKYK